MIRAREGWGGSPGTLTSEADLDTPATLVSVVTPSLNQGRFILDTIRSVQRQDYPSIEHLVVDGGSTDGTHEALRASGVSWVLAPGGQSAAINRGWRMMRGEILAWLNSDDTYLPGAVREAVEFLREHPEADGVYGDCECVDAEGRLLRPYPVRQDDYPRMVRTTICDIAQPATFVRRRAVAAVGYLDESLEYVLDLDLWLRLGAVGSRLCYRPRRWATLRLHPEAKSVRALEGFAPELVRTYERLFERDDLAAEIQALRSVSLSNAHYRASQCLFWAGRFSEARREAARAWRAAPLNPRPQLLWAAWGSVARQLLERLRGNPYRAGIEG